MQKALTDARRRDTLLLAALFAGLRVAAVAGRSPQRFTDTAGYFPINFLGHAVELWTVPLLFRALPGDGYRVAAQTAIGIVCWSALAFAVARTVRDPVFARIGVVVVLLLGLSPQVTEWDLTILSESASLSLTVLLLACVLRLRFRSDRWMIGATIAVLVLWIFARQVQAALFLPFALVITAWIVARRRRFWPAAVVLAVVGIWSGYALESSNDVASGSAHDVIAYRVFRDPGGPEFFASHGLPGVARFKREAAQFGTLSVAAFYKQRHQDDDPAFDARLAAWVSNNWTSTEAEWLLAHPVARLEEAAGDSMNLLTGLPPYGHSRAVTPLAVQNVLWGETTNDLPIWLIVPPLLFLVALARRRPRKVDALAVTIVLVALAWYLVGYELAGLELARISIESAALLRIGLLLVALLSCERLLGRRSGALAQEPAAVT